MEIPQPPQDEDLRNIIDKLAVFVARNGVEFEAMTKQKQRDNPRFAFLFGGEFFNYYMYRVTTEQAILKHNAMRQQQQQQQQQMNPIQGGGGFGQFGSAPRMMNPSGLSGLGGPNPFDMGSQQGFDNFQRGGPAPGGQGPRFENRGFSDFNNDRMGNFQPRGNFDQNIQHQAPGPSGFDSRQSGPGQQGFEPRIMGGPGNFDQPRPMMQGSRFEGPRMGGPHVSRFDQRPIAQEDFDQRNPVIRPNFPPGGILPHPNQSAAAFEPQKSRFDQRPGNGGNFESRPQSHSRFDRGPVPNAGKILEAAKSDFDARVQPPPRAVGMEPTFEPLRGLDSASSSFSAATTSGSTSPSPVLNLEALTKQKAAFEEQIKQSELNLAGQQQVLLTQQQTQIDEAIRQMEHADTLQLASELNIDLNEFDQVLLPIIESCTKDSISSGKAWIFTHTSTPRHYKLVTAFLLGKTLDPKSSFNQRLHIIYLVNDVLHHCMRKGAEDLQQSLEEMVIPMFCFSKVAEAGIEENVSRLDKLFHLWETKSNYVGPRAVERLRNFAQTLLEYKNEMMQKYANVVAQIAASIQQTYDRYQTQHQMFCQHITQNLKNIEQQIQQAIVQEQIRQQQQKQQQQQQSIPPLMGIQTSQNVAGPSVTSASSVAASLHSLGNSFQPQGPCPPGTQLIAPPYIPPVEMNMPDLSRPPPGFPTPPPDKDLIPALPYYELPAALMVPLVKLDDDSYKPVDAKAIRLPPPCPPTERLLQAVEAFYAMPSHERPRDSEGWERLGLYEYFKAKNLARKQKEDDIREGRREKSRSPTPIRRDSSPNGGRSPPRRRYLSKSPTPNRSGRRRSRSRSPSTRRKKSSRRSRSRSRSPMRRSPTPPSFGASGLGMATKLDESNKGHQLLKKMGWGGTGLGINEQGIEAPISGGEVRERKDLYKGVGVSVNDPFENYRKSKGQAFVERMRARAEERL